MKQCLLTSPDMEHVRIFTRYMQKLSYLDMSIPTYLIKLYGIHTCASYQLGK